MKLIDELSRVWTFTHKVEALIADQLETGANIRAMEVRLRNLEDRMTRMEADRSQLITEARAAAGAAGTSMASIIISDVVTRVTRLEMRQDEVQKRLP